MDFECNQVHFRILMVFILESPFSLRTVFM